MIFSAYLNVAKIRLPSLSLASQWERTVRASRPNSQGSVSKKAKGQNNDEKGHAVAACLPKACRVLVLPQPPGVSRSLLVILNISEDI